MRFEVPQFIEVEDKIVGPLTWKQFVYLAGGAGILIIVYFVADSILILMLVGTPIAALAGFLAFHQINNRPFSVFLESFINYITKSKLYLWRKEQQQTIILREERSLPITDPVAQTQKKTLASLSRKLDMNTLQK